MADSSDTAANGDLEARAGVYELLSRLWLYEIDSSLIADLSTGPLGVAWTGMEGPIPAEDDIEDLAAEYCRLFVGPKDHAAPFQSVWETGQHGGEAVSSMKEYLSLLSEPIPKLDEIPDHLGVQLLLMGILLRCRAADEESEDLLALSQEFFAEHLTWTERLFESVASMSPHRFYGFLAVTTEEFLSSENEILFSESHDID